MIGGIHEGPEGFVGSIVLFTEASDRRWPLADTCPAVIEIVEHSKLQCQFVLIGCDVGAVPVKEGSPSPTGKSPRI